MTSLHSADPVPWAPRSTPIDLMNVLGAFGPYRHQDSRPTPGGYRRVAHLVESELRCVHDAPLPGLIGFLDGVQRTGLLWRVEALRDVLLVWVAAGTVLGDNALDHQIRLAAVCSELDTDAVSRIAPALPIVALPETTPWGLALSAADWVDGTRRRLELDAIAAAPATKGHVLTVDGSLPPVAIRDDLIGVVKSVDTDWITDPDLLPREAGWRSPALRLPASKVGERDRLTAYVRLHDTSPHHWWGHGLVRVEVYAESRIDLDSAAVHAWVYRGHRGYQDPRWPVQLKPMWNTERVLKLLIPHAFSILR